MATQPTPLTAFNTPATIDPAKNLDTNFTECGAVCLIYAGIAGGSANSIDLTIPLDITDYFVGMAVKFVASSNNTGPVTVNINGLPTNINAGDITGTALTANAFVTGSIYELTLCADVSNVLTFRITGSRVSSPVSSVFGRTGAVVAVGTDYASFYANINGNDTEPFSAESGTVDNQVVNISQFAALLASNGSQEVASQTIIKWVPLPSHSQADGSYTVNFASAFPNAFYGAVPGTYNPTSNPGLDSFIQFVSGNVNGATFRVQAPGSSPTSSHVTGFAICIGS